MRLQSKAMKNLWERNSISIFAFMKHETKTIYLDGHEVTLLVEPEPECIFVQPVDSHDMEEMDKEIDYIEHHSKVPFLLAAVKIKKWNGELTPWAAPPVFGKIPFGSGAATTLEFIVNNLLGYLRKYIVSTSCNDSLSDDDEQTIPAYLGGYSLAGLFALWSAYNTEAFDGVVAASPSVWYKDWLSFSKKNSCFAKRVYLSLGDTEWHSKNKLMATVADAIKEQKAILDAQGIDNTLVWNPGNHFTDNGVRTAKGFVWVSSPSLAKEEGV